MKKENRIPLTTAPMQPKKRLWVKMLMITPVRAEISIIPSRAIFVRPAFLEIKAPMAAKMIGVDTRMIENI